VLTDNKKVIQSPPPGPWTFWDFVFSGTNPIEEWRKGLSEEAEKLFNGLLKTNQKIDNALHWLGRGRHFFLEGRSKEERVWELGFQDSDRVQYRILGVFWPKHTRKQATLLIGCTHKQRVYDPSDCLGTAIKRKKMLSEGIAKRDERKIRTDY
jgi:hypothetical protein